MKKAVFLVLLLLVFCFPLLAEESVLGKYVIFGEKSGLWGLGGRQTIKLNMETGDSWLLKDGRWVAIERYDETAINRAEMLAKKMEVLKVEYESQITALKAKYEQQILDLKSKLQEAKTTAASEPKYVPVTRKTYVYRAVKPKVPAKSPEKKSKESETGEEGPPGWLSE
jgi:hypothetical protein